MLALFCMIFSCINKRIDSCIAQMIAIRLHNKDNKTSESFNAIPRLDSDSRIQTIGMLNAGKSQCEVVRYFAVNVSTVSRLNRKFVVTGSTKDRHKSGQPV